MEMIYFTRSADIKSGKLKEAFEYAVKIAAYVNENHGTNFKVLRNVGGVGQQVHWLATYDSLAAYEAASARILADAGYHAVAAEANGLIENWEDNIFATLL